jgi:hypothetical protein
MALARLSTIRPTGVVYTELCGSVCIQAAVNEVSPRQPNNHIVVWWCVNYVEALTGDKDIPDLDML